jgi:hypothetical protein
MSLMNLISQEEFDAMNEYRRLYAYENLSPEDEAPIKDVLRVWDQEKSNYLGKMFDNQLIFSKEIKYKRPHSELRDTFSEYLNVQSDNPMFIFRTYFTKKLEEYFTSEPDYLERAYFVFLGLLDPRILAENKAGIDFSVEINGKKIQVQEDSKPVKIIKKVVTALELDNELFENFRLVHSQILNQKLLTGELCVSIHPLDYMTMSDNENDWSSCMSWTERGCYRRGTVEMLNSSCVVVAYIKSTHNNFRFYGHEWNSKKWRQLFVVTKDFISGVKQYPYENDYFSTEALKLLGELATKNLGWNYYDEVTTFVDRYCGSDARPAKIGDSIKVWLTFSTDDMYNDFHSGYNSFALISSDITADTTLKTHYSGPQICMCCGEVAPCYDDEDGDPSDLICGNCIESESPIYQCT